MIENQDPTSKIYAVICDHNIRIHIIHVHVRVFVLHMKHIVYVYGIGIRFK